VAFQLPPDTTHTLFFPFWGTKKQTIIRQFPVICYFKETETPEWKWDRWFAAFDSYGRGQPHFFPGICNARQFKSEMEKRGVKRKPVPHYTLGGKNKGEGGKKA